MNERTGFLFFRSYYEALRDLDDNIRHQIYDAIFEYIFEDKLPRFVGVQNACFKLIKPTLDKSKAQYENGKKNGKKNTKDKTNQKPSESQPEAYKDKEYDTDNDMEYDIDKDIPAPASPSGKPPKRKYGEYKNILLTDDELCKLKERFSDWQTRIDEMSAAIEMKGYKYKSHYLAILKWAQNETEKGELKNEFKPTIIFPGER